MQRAGDKKKRKEKKKEVKIERDGNE